MSKSVSFRISGVGNNLYHDGQLACRYAYSSSNALSKIIGNDTEYSEILDEFRVDSPAYITYQQKTEYNLPKEMGMYALTSGGNTYSIYRREYQIYERFSRDNFTGDLQREEQIFVGEWTPVAVQTHESMLRDYNITADRSYQYIIYPNATETESQYANVPTDDSPYFNDYYKTGIPVVTHWDEWSLTELIPVENSVDAPILRKTYKADVNNVWLFKYSLETGSQSQNIQKSEIQTLGTYPKFGYGRSNYISGEVSCLLGSEIVPCSSEGYIERMRASIRTPLSSNEKTFMLKKWREIAYSPNPKLLKDIKGQSWIVQIISSSNTPHNFYHNQPDVISFSWKQIDSTDNIIITGEGSSSPAPGQISSVWYKKK